MAPDAGGYSRWPGIVLVLLFTGLQTFWWMERPRNDLQPEPTRVLGPLYFLANKSAADDVLGWILLVVLVPCVLAWPLWPTRKTAVVTIFAILSWIGPGILWTLNRAP